jgi:hypothetical protein
MLTNDPKRCRSLHVVNWQLRLLIPIIENKPTRIDQVLLLA